MMDNPTAPPTVVVHEDRKPVLYDAKDRPLVRPVGFRSGPGRGR